MEVHHGGFLGLHGDTIYVPFAAVDVISAEAVTLSCTADEALERYSQPPPGLPADKEATDTAQ